MFEAIDGSSLVKFSETETDQCCIINKAHMQSINVSNKSNSRMSLRHALCLDHV